jgi:DNA adenine methylase
MTAPTRPVLRWHGGKWLQAPDIIALFPPHRDYVEPYGGAASVLLRKPRTHGEIYNDLDDDVVNLFRVLQDDELASALVRKLYLTPFARCEFEIAWEIADDPVERARRLIIRSFMGFGAHAHSDMSKGHRSTGFRSSSSRAGSTPATDWANYPPALSAIVERMRGVTIEHRPAMQVMAAHDRPTTLHFVDPPYLPETRGRKNPYDPKHLYRHDMTLDGHVELLAFLAGGELSGMVVLCGYPSDLYDDALTGWRRIERRALADGARERTEVLWLNPAVAEALDRQAAGCGMPLFTGGALAPAFSLTTLGDSP